MGELNRVGIIIKYSCWFFVWATVVTIVGGVMRSTLESWIAVIGILTFIHIFIGVFFVLSILEDIESG